MDQSGSHSFHGTELAADSARALWHELAAIPAGPQAPVPDESESYRACGLLELVVIGAIYLASIGLAVWQVSGMTASPAHAASPVRANGSHDTGG